MANTIIQIRSSGVTGNVPAILQPGELAINFVDGKLFYGNDLSTVTEFSTTTPAGLNGEIQFNSYGDLGATPNVRYESIDSYLYVNKLVANTLVNSTLTDAYDKAQGAYDLANTLTGGTSTDGWARNAANSASAYANSAFDKANSGTILAQSAFDAANNATDSWVRSAANSASSYANSAYLKANTTSVHVDSAYDKANLTMFVAQAAFDKANTFVDTYIDQIARDTANSSYNQANTASLNATSAGSYANSAFFTANLIASVALTGQTTAQFAYRHANSAYTHANSAYNEANTAYGLANTAFGRTTVNGSYANSAFIKANSSFDKANTSELIAQSAYDFANTLSISGGSTITISNENTSNNVYYINFTDKTSGSTPSLNVSSENLTFKPDTGTIGVKELKVSSNLSILSNTIEITGNSQTVVDSFSADLYRTAFYQFQVESGNDFHSFLYNVGQNGDTTTGIAFGDIYSSSVLGTISSNVSSGLVNILFTPTNETTIVSFSRNALVKTSTGIGNDLGFLGVATATFDYGFVGGSATSLDLGMLA